MKIISIILLGLLVGCASTNRPNMVEYYMPSVRVRVAEQWVIQDEYIKRNGKVPYNMEVKGFYDSREGIVWVKRNGEYADLEVLGHEIGHILWGVEYYR